MAPAATICGISHLGSVQHLLGHRGFYLMASPILGPRLPSWDCAAPPTLGYGTISHLGTTSPILGLCSIPYVETWHHLPSWNCAASLMLGHGTISHLGTAWHPPPRAGSPISDPRSISHLRTTRHLPPWRLTAPPIWERAISLILGPRSTSHVASPTSYSTHPSWDRMEPPISGHGATSTSGPRMQHSPTMGAMAAPSLPPGSCAQQRGKPRGARKALCCQGGPRSCCSTGGGQWGPPGSAWGWRLRAGIWTRSAAWGGNVGIFTLHTSSFEAGEKGFGSLPASRATLEGTRRGDGAS